MRLCLAVTFFERSHNRDRRKVTTIAVLPVTGRSDDTTFLTFLPLFSTDDDDLTWLVVSGFHSFESNVFLSFQFERIILLAPRVVEAVDFICRKKAVIVFYR